LDRIAVITLEAVPAAAVAGMSMLGEDEQPTTAVYTDEESPEIDAAQYREGALLGRLAGQAGDPRRPHPRLG